MVTGENKMVSKLRLLLILICLTTIQIHALDGFKTILGSGNTKENHSAEAMLDGSYNTSTRFKTGVKEGWFQIKLKEEALIQNIDFNGIIPSDVTAYVEYDYLGYIKTFPSSFMKNVQGEYVIDLSEDAVVSDSVYIRFSGNNLDAVVINEVQINSFDFKKESVKKKLLISSSSNSSSYYTDAQHLVDGLVGTVWRTWNNELWGKSHWFVLKGLREKFTHKKGDSKWQSSFVELKPEVEGVYTNLDLFVDKEASGRLEISINNSVIPSTYELDEYRDQWLSIPLSLYGNISLIRLNTYSKEKIYSGIGEVELWTKDYPEKTVYKDIIPFSPAENITDAVFDISELDYNDNYQLIVTIDNPEMADLKTIINNDEIKYTNKSIINNYEQYRYNLSDRDLVLGDNAILFSGHTGIKVLNSQIHKVRNNGRIQTTKTPLSDNRLYSGYVNEETLLEFSLGEALVETVRVYYKDILPQGLFYYTEEGSQKIFLTDSTDRGTFLEWSVNKNLKNIGLLSPAGASEIVITGKNKEVKIPYVKILYPVDNQVFEVQEPGYKIVWGVTDSPESEITINGYETKRYGNYFWADNSQFKRAKSGIYPITAKITQNDGTSNSDIINMILKSNTNEFSIDQEDIIHYTKNDFFTLSGTTNPWNTTLFINNREIDVYNETSFSYDLLLKDGLNTIIIEFRHKRTGDLKDIYIRKVHKESVNNSLIITSPTEGVVVNSDKIDVTGIASSRGLEEVLVNGVSASLLYGRFKASSIPVMEKENIIVVESRYKNGERVKKSITVNKDLNPPVISEIIPGDNSWFATHYVTVSGKVTDENSVSVFVNKLKATIKGDTFTVDIPVKEVQNDVLIEARDNSGNLTSYPAFNVNTDLSQPEEFIIVKDPASWTSNRRPIISFNTSDSFSGISHYEVSINGGKFIPQSSPYKTPFLEDGIIPVIVRAYDKVGNFRDSHVDLLIDTTPPDAPDTFRAVAGNESISLRWSDSDDETVSYTIKSESDVLAVVKRDDYLKSNPDSNIDIYEWNLEGLKNGENHIYSIYATDRAGNISEEVSDSIVTGITVEEYNDAEGALVEFEDVYIVVPKKSLPENVKEVVLSHIESEEMLEKAINPVISPILNFSVLKDDNTKAEHISFKENFIGEIKYDESLIPEGFPERNLGVYYFDENWSRWIKVKDSGVDIEENRIFFATDHFSSFTVQPTVFEDLSPEELRDVEYTPFNSKIVHQPMYVSPQGGSASTSMTELSLPGKNGFDFELRRIYDTTTARGDSSGLNMNVSVTLGDILSGEAGPALLSSAGMSVAGQVMNTVKSFLQNNGDYAYSLGQGWRLNLPYIRGCNGGVIVRTPTGSFYDITSMDMMNVDSFNGGVYRKVVFENHEGEDFTLIIHQARLDFSAKQFSSEMFDIYGWQLLSAELILKDGTSYKFDPLGRLDEIVDPTGLNQIKVNYDGLLINNITDSMGRKIKFDYTKGIETTVIPQINRIWIENDPLNREINYTYGNPGDMKSELNLIDPVKLPLLKNAKDVNGRNWSYDYDFKFLFAGEFGIKVNPIAAMGLAIAGPAFEIVSTQFGLDTLEIHASANNQWTFPMDFMQGTGLGTTNLSYKLETLNYFNIESTDYFLNLFPTAIQVDIGLEQRTLVNNLKLFLDGEMLKNENYSYDYRYIWNKQFFNRKTVVDDGNLKTAYYYTSEYKKRLTVFDWSDYALSHISSAGKDENGDLSLKLDLFKESVWRTDVIPLNYKTKFYDSKTGELYSVTRREFYRENLLPKEIIEEKSEKSFTLTSIEYDNWGNQTSVFTEEHLAGIVTRSALFRSYYNTESPLSEEIVWDTAKLGSFNLKAGKKERYNLLRASAGINNSNYDGSTIQTQQHNSYNEYGQLKQTSSFTHGGWSEIFYEHGYNNGLTGEITKITTPTGQVIEKSYDFTKPTSYSVTEIYKNILNIEDNTTSDIVSHKGYDRTMGLLQWSTDARGYTTEYEYDKLGRITKIIYPDNNDDLNWNPLSITNKRDNNPVTSISYDDVKLIVTKSDRNSSVSEYEFDNLSRLTSISKLNGENTTKFKYDKRNNIIEFENPNKDIITFTYDPLNRVTSQKYTENGEERTITTRYSRYKDKDFYQTITNEEGIKTRIYTNFKDQPLKTEYFGEYGELLSLEERHYDSAGNLVAIKDPMNNITRNIYDNRNLLLKTVSPIVDYYIDGQTVRDHGYIRYEYDLAGQKVAEIKGIGEEDKTRTDLTLDGMARIIKQSNTFKDVDNNISIAETKFVYDGNGNVTRTIDPRGKIWVKQYDARNNVNYELDPLNNKTSYTYDNADRLKSMTDPRENSGKYENLDFTIIYHYDTLDRLISAELPARLTGTVLDEKPVIKFSYDQVGNVLSRIEPDMGKTEYTYSSKKRVLTETRSGVNENGEILSYTTTYDYDSLGNLIQKTLPDNKTTTEYLYDVRNRLIKESYTDGSYREFGYDNNGNKIWETSPNGYNTLYKYDALNRLEQVTDYEWNTIINKYDLAGNISHYTDFNGNVFESVYNEVGSLLKEINPRGQIKKFYYDLSGNLIRDIDFNNTSATYTAMDNNNLKSITYINGEKSQSVEYLYDEAGAVKSVTDNGVTTEYNRVNGVYRPDPYDQKFSVETKGYSQIKYDYDYLNRVTEIKYDSGLDVKQNYNNLSMLESITGFVDNREYNTNGYPVNTTFSNGVTSQNTFTEMQQLKSLSYSYNGVDLKRYDFTYDVAGNIVSENDNLYGYDGKNQLTTALLTGGASEETFVLDDFSTGEALNDVLGQDQVLAHTVLTEKELDIDWGAKSFAIDTGYSYRVKVITLHRDGPSDDRINHDTISIFSSNYNRDRAFSKVEGYSLEDKNGDIVITFSKAVFARYIKIHSHYNELNKDGSPKYIRSQFRLDSNTPVTIEAVSSGRNEFYTLDAKGNRIQRTIMSKDFVTDKYTYYDNSDLLRTDLNYGYIYDNNGNLIKKGKVQEESGETLIITPSEGYFEYVYDLKNRLIEVYEFNTESRTVEKAVSYIYDAHNYRIEKTDRDNKKTRYVFDIFGNCIEEMEDGKSRISYVFMNNRHIARVSNGKTLFYGVNNVGSTVLLTDEKGIAVWNGDITPYGDKQQGIGSINESVKYTGKHLDSDTGLYYFNARWYDSNLGRFITEDPINDGINWYVYARNNPLRFIDPTGLKAKIVDDQIMEGTESAKQTYDEQVEIVTENLSDITGMEVVVDEDGYIEFGEELVETDDENILELRDRMKEIIESDDEIGFVISGNSNTLGGWAFKQKEKMTAQNKASKVKVEDNAFMEKHNLSGIVVYSSKVRGEYRSDNPKYKGFSFIDALFGKQEQQYLYGNFTTQHAFAHETLGHAWDFIKTGKTSEPTAMKADNLWLQSQGKPTRDYYNVR